MNVQKILALADVIEAQPLPGVGFNLNTWGSDVGESFGVLDGGTARDVREGSEHICSTVACIAGTQYALDHGGKVGAGYSVFDYGQDALDLSHQQAAALFIPGNLPVKYRAVTAQQAARCLRLFAITGKVDWPAAMAPSPEIEAKIAEAKGITEGSIIKRLDALAERLDEQA